MTIKRLHLDDLKALRSDPEFVERDRQIVHFALVYVDKCIREACLDQQTECGFELNGLIRKGVYLFVRHVVDPLMDSSGLDKNSARDFFQYLEDNADLVSANTCGIAPDWMGKIKPSYWRRVCLPMVLESLQQRGFKACVVDPKDPPAGVIPLPKRKGKYLHVWFGML